ncbi:alpha/beta hydrolase [Pinibacter aurantiacus]|uniref:Alpha/beta hydrolase n=1 Tax=Pinibacter aurantiacus TaxID=2851599 RepID=A0A9E2W9U4_9BACT|nr:alpha/beta hydrolase [Pinibacter aurantiacus]MBV4360242.1 alpha/beta hydrolase [Pinibacter aurantiacus]
MNYSELKYIYQPAQNTAQNTLLLLHGTGGDENDLLPVAKYFGDNFNILSLRGNVSEGGMPRFFRRLGMGIFDEKDLAYRTDEMVHFIKDLAIKENFDAGKIIALGYSNGANIAGSTLLQYPDFLAGAILYRPMQPFKEIPATAVNTTKTPIFMSNGTTDPTIDPAATVRYVEVLKNGGFDVTDYNLQTSHGLTQQDIQLSVEWFKKHFG